MPGLKTILCVLLLTLSASNARALSWISEQSGKCLDIEYASQADKARLIQWTCDILNNQNINHFKLNITTGGQQYELKVMHSNKCLDIPGNSDRNGTIIVQYRCHRLSNQRFWVEQLGENTGIYRIRSVSTKKCLDIEGASMQDRAKVILWDCHDGANQRFQFTPDKPTSFFRSR